jgi:hypothetical protein
MPNKLKEQAFRKRLSGAVCKPPYAGVRETGTVVNDKEKRKHDFAGKCIELNRVNHDIGLDSGKDDVESKDNGFLCDRL